MHTLARIASWLCLSGGSALAQTTLISIDGSAPGELFGAAVAGPGDVDGDGVPDLAVGVPEGASGGATPGVVRMFSGASGDLLWETPGALTKTQFGQRMLAIDDVDGDGVRDLLVRPGPPGLGLLSGRSGAVLWLVHTHPFLGWGVIFTGLGDLDADGVGDIGVGSPIGGQFTVLSGSTQLPIHTWTDGSTGACVSLARAGDLDGDGTDDVLAGWRDGNQVLPHKVIAYSGGTKLPLFELVAPADAVTWAWSLAGDADLDGDGLPEIAVSDPYHGGEAGRVTVYRGSDLGLHFEVGGAPGMRLGMQLAYAGDVDGDGIEDLLCGSDAVHGATGVVRVYSGATGALVLELQGPSDEGFASAVAALGDVDGDGANDVAFGWHGANGDAGSAIVLAGPCPAPASYCTAQVNSQGCASELGWSGSPQQLSGAPFVLRGSNLIAGSPGLVIYSLAGANAQPALGGTLCVQPPFARAPAGIATGAGACGGVLGFDFGAWADSGADPALVPGSDVWAQVWSRDPGAASGSNLTDALSFAL